MPPVLMHHHSSQPGRRQRTVGSGQQTADSRQRQRTADSDSGQRQRAADSGQRAANNDSEQCQWTADSRHRTVDSGQWTVDSGQWTVDSGQRAVDSGQRTAHSEHLAANRGRRGKRGRTAAVRKRRVYTTIHSRNWWPSSVVASAGGEGSADGAGRCRDAHGRRCTSNGRPTERNAAPHDGRRAHSVPPSAPVPPSQIDLRPGPAHGTQPVTQNKPLSLGVRRLTRMNLERPYQMLKKSKCKNAEK